MNHNKTFLSTELDRLVARERVLAERLEHLVQLVSETKMELGLTSRTIKLNQLKLENEFK